MKNIIKILKLKPDATEEEIIAEIEKRDTAHAVAHQEIDRLKAVAKGLPRGINEEALAEKLKAGLPKDMAIDVLLDQAKHDATKPHDATKAAK